VSGGGWWPGQPASQPAATRRSSAARFALFSLRSALGSDHLSSFFFPSPARRSLRPRVRMFRVRTARRRRRAGKAGRLASSASSISSFPRRRRRPARARPPVRRPVPKRAPPPKRRWGRGREIFASVWGKYLVPSHRSTTPRTTRGYREIFSVNGCCHPLLARIKHTTSISRVSWTCGPTLQPHTVRGVPRRRPGW
jgi:hypothetical protein